MYVHKVFALNSQFYYNICMRLNKYLATCGLGSRRKCEQFISDNRVTINGQHVFDLSTIVNEGDVVCVDGRIVKPCEKKIYLMLNKPVCYITACSDDRGRKCVVDLVPSAYGKVFPVGRLDYNTSGLLLLTNDGDFANKIIHPSNNVTKTYTVSVRVKPTNSQIKQLRSGIQYDGVDYLPAKVSSIRSIDDLYEFDITIIEGKNREIRNMCKAVNIKLIKLKRISIGNLMLKDLPSGKIRVLNENDLRLLEG